MSKKNITIDDLLARMIKKGFDETATKAQMVKVEERLDNIEGRLDNMEKLTLKQQGERIQNHERRIQRMEEMFAVK